MGDVVMNTGGIADKWVWFCADPDPLPPDTTTICDLAPPPPGLKKPCAVMLRTLSRDTDRVISEGTGVVEARRSQERHARHLWMVVEALPLLLLCEEWEPGRAMVFWPERDTEMVGASRRHCKSMSGTDRIRFKSSSSRMPLLSSDVPMCCDNWGLVVRYVEVRSWRIRIGFVPPEYGFVRVTAIAPPITVELAPPPLDDSDAEEAWLALLVDRADISEALCLGPLTLFDEPEGPEGPPPSKLRDTVDSLWLAVTIMGAGAFEVEATSREAVSSELP